MKSLLRYILIILFTLATISAWAQEEDFRVPDSLMAQLKENRGTDLKRAEALDAYIDFCYAKENISQAASYINELEQLSHTLNDNYWIAKSNYFQGVCAFQNGDVGQAFQRLNQALHIAETMVESERTQELLARIYLLQSASYIQVDLLPDAYESVEKGLAITEKYGFKKIQDRLVNNKSSISYAMGDKEESLRFLKELGGQDMELTWAKNISDLYCELGECEVALRLIDSIYQHTETDSERTDVLLTKCFILSRMERWCEAEDCMRIADSLNVNSLPLRALMHMRWSEVYCGLDEPKEALQSIDSALILAKMIGNSGLKCNALQRKANILKHEGDHQAALGSIEEFWMLYDSITARNNKSKVTALMYQHEFDRMEQQYESEHALLRLRQRFTFIIAGLLILSACLFAFMVWKNKKRKEEMLKMELDYRNREITSKTLNSTQLNETLNEVIHNLTNLKEHPYGNDNTLASAIHKLKGLVNDDSKKEFDYYFVEVHPDFYANLKKDFPDLTTNELRLCAFAKLNLPLKKIAEINNVSIDSVKSSRKRLRKSLGIDDPKIDLADFLSKY